MRSRCGARPLFSIELQPGERHGEHGLERPRRLVVSPELAHVLSPHALAAYLQLAGRWLRFGPKDFCDAEETKRYELRRMGSPKAAEQAWQELLDIGLIAVQDGRLEIRQGKVKNCGLRLLYLPDADKAKPTRVRVKRTISTRTRWIVLQRDGFRCSYCGASAADGAPLHVDHVVAVANGGPDALANLVAACADCNLGKSDLEVHR